MMIFQHRTTNYIRQQQPGRQKENRIGGFTLVELIVVLAVLSILCTLGVMGMIEWQQHADLKKQNQYAESIFVAAQIQLTQYAERGQLTKLTDSISDTGKADFVEYRRNSPEQIYYLKAKKGDYQIYLKELKGLSWEEMKLHSLENRRIRLLYDMLEPYIADKSMLDATICLEFDPDPKVALVYSVFYNEKAVEFTDDSEDSAMGGEM